MNQLDLCSPPLVAGGLLLPSQRVICCGRDSHSLSARCRWLIKTKKASTAEGGGTENVLEWGEAARNEISEAEIKDFIEQARMGWSAEGWVLCVESLTGVTLRLKFVKLRSQFSTLPIRNFPNGVWIHDDPPGPFYGHRSSASRRQAVRQAPRGTARVAAAGAHLDQALQLQDGAGKGRLLPQCRGKPLSCQNERLSAVLWRYPVQQQQQGAQPGVSYSSC